MRRANDSFTSEGGAPLDPDASRAIAAIALELRRNSWELADACVDLSIDRGLAPSLSQLEGAARVAKLPAFIGGLGAALARPRVGRRIGTNPVLVRLARDHVVEREAAGLTAREIVQEFLALRRVLWRFVLERVDDEKMDARTVLHLEDLLNSIVDEVITEATVTYLDRATHELSERSRRDSLTGLLNHQAFHDRLDDEVDRCERYGHELQVIYLDLDDFKQVNDSFGHAEGDRLLALIAGRLRACARSTDTVARLGGDEFAILVEDDDSAKCAERLVDRILEQMTYPFSLAMGDVTISASVGSASTLTGGLDEIMRYADVAMYAAKRSGRGMHRAFEDSMLA
jgi:diguanylate cyclase (GGDEF)-like protein